MSSAAKRARARGHRPQRAVRGVTLLVAAVALLACTDDGLRDEEGRVVEAGEFSVFELQEGDCLDPGSDVSGEIADLPVVPCEQPHTQEVYGIVTHPDESYPGATEVAAHADGACLNALETNLGLTLDDGVFFSYLLPTFDGWNTGGDRQITCVLVFPEVEAMTGSLVEGTAELEPRAPAPPQEPDDDLDDDLGDEGDDDIGAAAADRRGV